MGFGLRRVQKCENLRSVATRGGWRLLLHWHGRREMLARWSDRMNTTTPLAEIAEVLQTTESNALARMSALEIGPACGRCHGSGHYSRNYYGQTHCYECNGRMVCAPRNAPEWAAAMESARAVVASGRLALYLEARAIKATVDNASKRALSAWSASGVSKAYKWHNSYPTSPTYTDRDHHIGTVFNGPMVDAHKRVDLACTAFGKLPRGADRDAAAIALAGVLSEALETIHERSAALADWLAANPAT